jgi:hypothetical protein
MSQKTYQPANKEMMVVYCENRMDTLCPGEGGYGTYSYGYAVKMKTYFSCRLLYLAALSLLYTNVLWLENLHLKDEEGAES